VAPVGLLENLRIDLPLPEDGEALALRIILKAGKINQRLLPDGLMSRFDGFHQIAATADLYDLAGR
jgi:hypothetical protein